MAKQSSPAKADPTMDAIYDPKTYAGHEVTGDWRQGFSVTLNGIPLKFTRVLMEDAELRFEVWAEVADGSETRRVLLAKATYDSRASRLMQEFSDRTFDVFSQRQDADRRKAIDAILWAAEGNRGQ